MINKFASLEEENRHKKVAKWLKKMALELAKDRKRLDQPQKVFIVDFTNKELVIAYEPK